MTPAKKSLIMKITVVSALVIFVLAMAVCFATESGNTSVGDYSGLITTLNNGLGATAFTGVLSQVLPYIIGVTLVALVWYLIKKAIKKFSKGKPGV